MSATISTTSSLLLSSYGRTGTLSSEAQPSLAQLLTEDATSASQLPASTTVALSDDAKAYLARLAAAPADAGTSAATRAANARQWFDQQYKTLGISSALLDGKVAVDLTGQSRATLSAVASNGQGLFSKDESTAAATALRSRFDEALTPYAVIARHTGNYADLYDAALKFIDAAGTDEKATKTWQDQRQALVDGAALARKTPGKAPDSGNAADPIKALLAKPAAGIAITSQTTVATVAANARALLDAQAGSAKDKGTVLVFDAASKTGQKVDFAKFDNRSLATIAINQGSSFSFDEVRSAKSELDQRNRTTVLGALKSTSGSAASSLDLLNRYAAMSAEEKSALGVSDGFTNQLVQTYQSIQSTQNRLGENTSLGLGGYL